MWGVAGRNFYVQNFYPHFFCAIADPSRTISSLESMSIGLTVFDDMRAEKKMCFFFQKKGPELGLKFPFSINFQTTKYWE